MRAFFLLFLLWATTAYAQQSDTPLDSMLFKGELAYGNANWQATLSPVAPHLLPQENFSLTLDATFFVANPTPDYRLSATLLLRRVADSDGHPIALGDGVTGNAYATTPEGLALRGVAPVEVQLAQAHIDRLDPQENGFSFQMVFEAPLASLETGLYAPLLRGTAQIGDSQPFDWYANNVFGALKNGVIPPHLPAQRDYALPFLVYVGEHLSFEQTPDGYIANGIRYHVQEGWVYRQTEAGDLLPLALDTPEIPDLVPNSTETVYGRRGIYGQLRAPQARFDTAHYPLDLPISSETWVYLPFFQSDTLTIPNTADFAIYPAFTLNNAPLSYDSAYVVLIATRSDGTLWTRFAIGGESNPHALLIRTVGLPAGETLTIRAFIVQKNTIAYYETRALITDGKTARVTESPGWNAPAVGLPIYALPDPARYRVYISSSLVVTPRGRLLVSNPTRNSVSLLTPSTGTLDREYTVGASPRHVALASNGDILTLNRADQSITTISTTTDETKTEPLENRAYALTFRAENTPFFAPTPVQSLAIWGDIAYSITENGALEVHYLPTQTLIYAHSFPDTRYHTLTIDPQRATLFVTGTFTLANSPSLDATYQPFLFVFDLKTLTLQHRIALDVAFREAHAPLAIALDNARSRVYIAFSASQRVLVLEVATFSYVADVATESYPIALAFNRDGTRLFVHNAIANSITVYDTRFHSLVDSLPTTTSPLPVQTLLGATLFYSAQDPRLAWQESASCATCHTQTQAFLPDALTVDFLQAHLREAQGGTGLSDLDLQALITYLSRGWQIKP